MTNATVQANARALPEATNRRAVLGAILAGGAVAASALPASVATAVALPTDPSAVSSASKIVTLEQMAAMNFEPWSHVEDEWTPPSDEEWAAYARSLLPQVRMAWLLMYKTKAQLEAAAIKIDEADLEEAFEEMVDGFINAQKFFKDFITVLHAAECRVMWAAAAVEYREGGPDEGEA
jgi:hypothetical protein